MVLRHVFIALGCATVLASSGPSVADEYRPDEFLGLDLSKVVLSPKPLGPSAQFVPGPLDVQVDRGSEAAQAGAEPKAEPTVAIREPKVVIREPKVAIHETRVVHARAEKPRGAARTKLARRHGNIV